VLPPDRLLDVEYEDLTADPAGSARRLIAFCGLASRPTRDARHLARRERPENFLLSREQASQQ
jgi:hypothetical protein